MPSLTDMILYGIIAAIFGAIALIPRTAASNLAAADRTAAAVGLALDESVVAVVITRNRRSRRWTLLMGAFAVCLLGVVGSRAIDGATGLGTAMLPFAVVTIGGSLGAAIAAGIDARASRRIGPGLARSRAVTLDDFVAPTERVGSRAVVVCAVLLALLGSCLPGAWGGHRAAPTIDMLTLAAAAALALAFFEVGGRRIVAHPQRAGSTTELAWDDALRAENLRSIVSAPLSIGVLSMVSTVATLTPPTIATTVLGAAIVALIALIIAHTFTTPRKHYLRRLWPETARVGDALLAPTRVAE